MRCDKCLSVVDIEDLRDVRVVSFGGIGRDADPLDYEIPEHGIHLDLCDRCTDEMVVAFNNICREALHGVDK